MRISLPRALRRVAAVASLSILVSLVPAFRVEAASGSISFDGAGWGHGVGLSQYGAYGRALDGQSHEEILLEYYGDDGGGGTSIGQLGVDVTPLDTIVTNVASDITSTTLTVFDGPGSSDTGMTVTRLTGEATPPTATLHTGDRVVVTDTTPLPGSPNGCEVVLTIAGEQTTWAAGEAADGVCDITVSLTDGASPPANVIRATNIRATNCRRPGQCTYGYGESFRVVDNASEQRRVNSTLYADTFFDPPTQTFKVYPGFDLVVVASPDDYTRGVAEVPFSWGVQAPAALRAQAIAARSYASSFAVSTEHQKQGCFCDVKNDSSYLVYAGWLGGWDYNSLWDQAAMATAGQVLVHANAPDQDIVRAYFSSSNGGASEWVKDKWGGDLPYLLSVDDPWSVSPEVHNPNASWSETFDAETVVDKIWGTSANYRLTRVTVIAHNVSGSAKTIRFEAVTSSGSPVSKDVTVGTVQQKFGLLSWYFDIDDSGLDPTGPTSPGSAGPDGVAVQDPTTGIWSLRHQDGSVDAFYFGNPLDIPFIGDWNGNGIDTVGLYRESAGYLFLRSTNTQGIADIEIYYGDPGDLPVAGDWDGDGDDTVGIYRRSDNTFYLRNSNTQGIADIVVPFGDAGDVPIAGDWDGDGKDSIGIYRPSTKVLYLVNDLEHPVADFTYTYQGAAAGDQIVAGDWNHDGVDTVGVFRPSTAMWYLRDTYTQASANLAFEFGEGHMNPVAGYWGD